MTAGAAVWWALVAVEVTALALAVCLSVFDRRNIPSTFANGSAGKSCSTLGKARKIFRGPLGPLVALLAYALADEIAVEAIRLHVAHAPRPFHGTAAALYHASNALVLGWPAALSAAAWRVFSVPQWHPTTRRLVPGAATYGPRRLFGAWLVVLGALVVSHPLAEGPTRAVLVAFEVAALASALVAIGRAWGRPWSREHVAIGLLVAVEVAVCGVGPWVHDCFRDWAVATAGYLVGFGALAGVLGSWLRGDRRRSTATR